jgi:hypothetical protein
MFIPCSHSTDNLLAIGYGHTKAAQVVTILGAMA